MPISLKARALRLLSQREHSRAELERKLSCHEEQAGELVRMLNELAAQGLISEERVAESVMRRRAPRLSAEALAEAAGQLRATELERARAVWQKKFGAPAADAAARARQARFLAARGFAADVVRRVLNAWPDADESSSDFSE